MRCFLLVVKCGTHQAALSAKSGVTGSFAAAVGGELYKTVAGTAVRLFKYITNDYYEEFRHSVRDWVSKKLHVLAHSDGHRSPPAGLRDLYSSHVIPDEMMFLWNNGLKPMHEDKCLLHEVGVGVDPTTERHALVARFTLFIVQLLRVDSHPTVTRFFTFRANLDRMLAMHFIGMVPKCFRVLSTKPREENKKRIALVQGFFAHPEASQVLRRSSLILQLTGGVEALTATTPRAGEDPVLVSLVKGAVDDVVTTRLQRLFGAVHRDLVLDWGAAAGVLLATAADIVVRFRCFRSYPFKLARMCRVWFPVFWYHDAFQFLHEEEHNLDIGVGLQLQRPAWAKGSETLALSWLASASVQRFVEQLCEEALSTSLPVERRFGEVKQWERSRSTNIATASRNMIMVRFAKQREQLANAAAAAVSKLRRARMTKTTSLKWQAQEDSDLAAREEACCKQLEQKSKM